MRRLLVLSAVVVGVGASGAGATSRPPRVPVHPAVGGSRTRFVVRFTAPATSGGGGSTVVSYQVNAVRGRGVRAGCQSQTSVPVASARKGQRVRVVLAPRGRWCAGLFNGDVQETIRPQCSPGAACPQFIAARPIGVFTFTVR